MQNLKEKQPLAIEFCKLAVAQVQDFDPQREQRMEAIEQELDMTASEIFSHFAQTYRK